jgi:hypothetical protein
MNEATTGTQPWPDKLLDEAMKRGARLYETQLRASLEANAMGQLVAIHPESGDYVVASREEEAVSELRARRANGLLFVRRIGPPTSGDLRLAARISGRFRGKSSGLAN